jgi:hypothetical protein
MKNVEDEEHIKDPMVNIILIFDLQMNNKSLNSNNKSVRFGMQRSENDLPGVSTKLTLIFS